MYFLASNNNYILIITIHFNEENEMFNRKPKLNTVIKIYIVNINSLVKKYFHLIILISIASNI